MGTVLCKNCGHSEAYHFKRKNGTQQCLKCRTCLHFVPEIAADAPPKKAG